MEFFAEEAKRIEGGVLPGPTPSKRILVLVKLVKMVKMVWVRTVRLRRRIAGLVGPEQDQRLGADLGQTCRDTVAQRCR